MTQSPTPVIDIKDLYFAYNGEWVLENVSLTVEQGEFLAFIGPNGGGKTTLVKLLLGLLEPARGVIRVLGRPPRKVSSRLGYVPQDTGTNKSVPVTAEYVVLMGRMTGGGGFSRFSDKDKAAAREALEQVGLTDLRDRRMAELSGGQRQRVLLARALVSRPELLLLDEPTASVDPKAQGEFFQLLKDINERTTIVLVSHDLMAISTHVKSVACVSRLVHFHNRPEVTKDMLESAYHCPVELIAHGLPHRVFPHHED